MLFWDSTLRIQKQLVSLKKNCFKMVRLDLDIWTMIRSLKLP
uniref:Uncharacterized protein n=1 Tax=Ascaris lumbricoides TaxID=6252 RepID=A0A0M3HM13_ASCLU